MAWVAVDKGNVEFIYDKKPYRDKFSKIWVSDPCVKLRRGSIEKLIGRKLTWEDNPVKL